MVLFTISSEINLEKFLPSTVQSLQSVLRNEEWIEKPETSVETFIFFGI